eukprot:scaffold1308_cov406-Ochromonas_danica.AAC.1
MSHQVRELAHMLFLHPSNPLLSGGSAASAGYVRRMEAEKKIMFDKNSRPSKYMIEKYGSVRAASRATTPVIEYDEPVADHYDYNVGRPKPKRVSAAKRGPTEVQLEREERAC